MSVTGTLGTLTPSTDPTSRKGPSQPFMHACNPPRHTQRGKTELVGVDPHLETQLRITSVGDRETCILLKT